MSKAQTTGRAQDPGTLGAEPAERRRRIDRRAGDAEPRDEAEKADVQRAERRRGEDREAFARVQAGERADADEHDAQRGQQQARAAGQLLDRVAERDDDREHDAEQRQRCMPGRRSGAGTPPRPRATTAIATTSGDPEPAEPERDQQRRDEDRGTAGAIAEHPASAPEAAGPAGVLRQGLVQVGGPEVRPQRVARDQTPRRRIAR